MSSTEAPISITVKTAAGSLVTVRAEHGDELDQIIATTLESIRSAVTELELVVRGNPSPQQAMTPSQIATILGGNIIETGSTIPAQEYSQSIIGGRMCPHGKMTAIQGTGKDGKTYRGYFCPAPKGAFDKCKNQYVRAGTPEWNTFVADQVK